MSTVGISAIITASFVILWTVIKALVLPLSEDYLWKDAREETQMNFSVIVPAYNASRTIHSCLEEIFNSDFKGFEVIVIDDASNDSTVDIAKKFPCRIVETKKRLGTHNIRNMAKNESHYDTLVYIDSDILIKPDTLSKIEHSFREEPDLAAVVGVLSKEHPNNDYFSQYKNLYMHYILNKCPRFVDFIYGAIYAIKKRYFQECWSLGRFGEDTDLGMRLCRKNLRILLNKDIEVVHLKEYSFISFLRNDFIIPYYWAKIFIRQRGWVTLLKKKRFSHAHASQIVSIVLAGLTLPLLFVSPLISTVLVILFLFVNSGFFTFLYRQRGAFFVFQAVFLTWLDMLVMLCGIICGFIIWF
jgi:glycosyltransferase involved in cell wall biosynthesis